MARVATISGIIGAGAFLAGIIVPMLIPSLPPAIAWMLLSLSVVLIAVPIVWSLLGRGGKDDDAKTIIHNQHIHNYATLPDLAGLPLLDHPPAAKPEQERVPIQVHDSHHEHTASEPVVHHLQARDVVTGPPEIGSPTLNPMEFPPGLYVGMVILSASKLADEHFLEIAIRAFNGTGEPLRVAGINGAIKAGEANQSEQALPSAEWTNEDMEQPIEAYREFQLVLRQHLPSETAADYLRVVEESYVSMDLRALNVEMQTADERKLRTRLPLWDGVTIRRRDDIFTGRMIMASANIMLQPMTAVATGVVTDGKSDE